MPRVVEKLQLVAVKPVPIPETKMHDRHKRGKDISTAASGRQRVHSTEDGFHGGKNTMKGTITFPSMCNSSPYARSHPYSGNRSAISPNCPRIFASRSASARCSSSSAIHAAIVRISPSPMPRVVRAGVPCRITLGFIGGFVSNGIAFLLTVIPASPRARSLRHHDPRIPFCKHIHQDQMRVRAARNNAITLSLHRLAQRLRIRNRLLRISGELRLQRLAQTPTALASAITCINGPPCWQARKHAARSIPAASSCVAQDQPRRADRAASCA